MNEQKNALSQNEREFDLILFGASGATGQLAVEELARTSQTDRFNWAISGRNAEKLFQVLVVATEETGIDLKDIPIIEADINDQQSLKAMTSKTKLVLNCVGPFSLLGEPMIDSCLETATHQLDISAETLYTEKIQLKCDKKAKDKGIYIVSSCGFDSIVADLGIRLLKKNFDGVLNAVETYVSFKLGPEGLSWSYSVWNDFLCPENNIGETRRQFWSQFSIKKTLKSKFRLKSKVMPFKSKYVEGWCLPWTAGDQSVVQRTEQFRYEQWNERPAQIETYFTVPNFLYVIGVILFGAIIGLMASFEWGLSLLKSYPEFFSFGIVSKDKDPGQLLRGTSFVTTIVGTGWDEKFSDTSNEPNYPPNKTVLVQVKGPLSSCIVQSGLTLLKESDKIPQKGGVLTPGAAFAETTIYKRLKDHSEMTFEFINQ